MLTIIKILSTTFKGKMKEEKFMRSLFRLLRFLKAHMDQNLKDQGIGLTGMQVRTMKNIRMNENCTTQSISKLMNCNKAQVTPLVKELIKQKLVTKEANSIDKRSHFLILTDKGNELFERLRPTEYQIIKTMTRGLNKKELDEFTEKLNLMSENLET
jgi:MarR family transcriptional regulator, multiple antibiotic resistance protein MarR